MEMKVIAARYKVQRLSVMRMIGSGRFSDDFHFFLINYLSVRPYTM